jgi:segregation and condensation protein A
MYKIKLPNFDGPFDLMLYFIKRDELNIYDIPIAKITEEFLKYIRLMQMFDLELAGEFLVMASTLMYIKTQMLLPRNEEEADGDIEDPRTQLVQRLIEYKQFKEAANELREISEENRYIYYRQLFEEDENIAASEGGIYKNATLFDLLKALNKAVSRNQEEVKQHVVSLIPVTVEEKSKQIISTLGKKSRVRFFDLCKSEPTQYVVVTFLALLDLMKLNKIIIRQDEIFDDIIISKKPILNLN